jgi:hypothetical protein
LRCLCLPRQWQCFDTSEAIPENTAFDRVMTPSPLRSQEERTTGYTIALYEESKCRTRASGLFLSLAEKSVAPMHITV